MTTTKRLERRGTYDGGAEVVVDERWCGSVRVRLSRYAEVLTTVTMGPHVEKDDGLTSWDGSFAEEISEDVRWQLLQAGIFTIRLPNGRSGDALMRSGNQFVGSGPAPFD